MFPVPAPPTTTGQEVEEHHEKKPVLKKVMDKVKKLKKAIRKKSPSHGNESDDVDHHQHGDLDEEDEEYEENEELKEDPAVHGVPHAGVGIGAKEILGGGGGEGTKGAGDGLRFILEEFDEDQSKPKTDPETDKRIAHNRSLPNAGIELTREYEGPATGARAGAKEISGGGGEGAEGIGESLNLTKEFVGDQALPRNEDEKSTGIEQSRAHESPATSVKTRENVDDPGAPKNEGEINTGIKESQDFSLYNSPATGARYSPNDISGGGREGAERDGDGHGVRLTTEKFVGDLAPPRTEAERNAGIERSQAYEYPATVARTGANGLSGSGGGVESLGDGLGTIREESVENPGAPITEAETNTGIEHSRGFPLHNSPVTGAISSANDILGGGEGGDRVNDGSGLIAKEFIEDPTAPTKDHVGDPLAPRTDDETNSSIEKSQVHLSPTSGARTGVNEMYEGGKAEGAEGVGDGLGLTPMELVEDPASPKTEAETNTKTEQSRGGQEVNVTPELCRSLDAMTVSSSNDGGEAELSKDKNNSYTDWVSSASSKVYGMVADAGTAVISKVKPDTRNEAEDEAVGKQGKGFSIKEYITEKLTPGDDEKALSEMITEGGQKRKNAAVEEPPPEKTSSEESGRGVGVVEKIRESVTSFLGVGEGSPKSPATEANRKVAEDNSDFLRRTPEAISHEKRSSEELPSSYHTDGTTID